ncbi:2-octaprenyl-6-methoxyphenyl hydroxylase [Parendozoicomonas haliclonae]|nr:2-octaprenyl-6-methoxyphenyl hydroxylase [Parendozoicomonas haliclonae]
MQARYDIVIVGGGMVGATLALGLRRALPESRSIAVIEAVDLPEESSGTWQPSYDARSSALSAGAKDIFASLGLWDAISQAAEPILDIHVSDRGHFGVARMHAHEHGVPALGYVADNSWLGQVLLSDVKATQGIDLLCPVSVKQILPEVDDSTLTLDAPGGEQILNASLVILADGGRSGLSRKLGIESDVAEYGQKAIVANITPAKHHNGVAYERFTDEGPMALLPRPGGDCALVWTMPEQLADERLELVDEDFLAELQDRFGYRVGRFKKVGERFAYPLALKTAREQVRPGLVVLGNAAHSLHPVAGQGFNLSLRDVQTLISTLAEAIEQQKNPGSLEVLKSYQQQREKDQQQTIGFSDQVVRLFSNNNVALAGARNFGLVAMDLLYPIKNRFARQAMGLSQGMNTGFQQNVSSHARQGEQAQ